MSTTNVQLQINSKEQQATGSEQEENHGRRKNNQEELSRRRGVLAVERASRSLAESSSIQGRKCARCGGAFGRFYNTGASCPRCRHRVCRQCREFRGSNGAANNKENQRTADWLCAVCHKIAELRSATGDWIYDAATLTNPRLVVVKKNSPVDIIKRSIRRAWTINGSPAGWSVARKSPAFRIYRSLPVREKIHQNIIDDDDDIEISSFSLPEACNKTVKTSNDHDNSLVSHRNCVEKCLIEGKTSEKKNYKDFHDERAISLQSEVGKKIAIGEEINISRVEKSEEKTSEILHENLTSFDSNRKKNERKIEQIESVSNSCEISTQRVSLIKPPRVIAKIATTEIKQSPKHGDRKSNIPIFRRNSREFEDIGSPQEKRSLIPQRYRGSTDDLRPSREDISLPSLIPKLFSPRVKEQEKLKRQDSRDDIRQIQKGNRREISKEENRREISKEDNRVACFPSSYVREDQKSNIKIFRRDSREDVSRETSSLPSLCFARGKNFSCKDQRQEKNEENRLGETITRSKSCPNEQSKISTKTFEKIHRDETTKLTPKIEGEYTINIDSEETTEIDGKKIGSDEVTKIGENKIDPNITEKNFGIGQSEVKKDNEILIMANEMTMIEERLDANEAKNNCQENTKSLEKDEEEIENLEILGKENLEGLNGNEMNEGIVESKEIIVENCSEPDFGGRIFGDRKLNAETMVGKRVDDVQVVRRKFSKEEFSNADDTDETPNRRSSSHLSPEASPLSTRSSRYSPRESESEPTPALPRKIGSGDSCTASQRVRDAITRTRRESNSSARYESSGSESIRLSESGLHGYADLARRVKLFGSGGNGPNPSLGNDEPVQRDSATSAGEDEPLEDCHSRGPGSSQGRTMLRRRRQFDAQGSRRRGRSHARTCCGEELQNLQALHVIGRGRQTSPTQEQQNPDYRRLVFISSDSSSGREEDDADSSCSGSSYLNGLPRNNHAQSLEDCDWDYFESGTLPLPTGGTESINVGQVDNTLARDWNCCPGRGSAACLACGGSPGANVLPVPVPIPVPVPYPVPVPASLWTGDFAAAASSMITRGATPEGTLRLRGDPSAPWFSWHPRFNQPLHGARIDPRTAIGSFDSSVFNFHSEEISPRIYTEPVERETLLSSSTSPSPEVPKIPTNTQTRSPFDPQDVEPTSAPSIAPEKPEKLSDSFEISTHNLKISELKVPPEVEESTSKELPEVPQIDSNENLHREESNDDSEDSSQSSRQDDDEERKMYENSRDDSGSSSGRSSADSSDLEDSASHRFSRVFVVNDDSLTSDNDMEENEDSDSPREAVVTLKRVTSVPEIEPVVLRRVRLLDEDMNLQPENPDPRNVERRPNRIERRIDLFAERDPDANEIYLTSSTDFSENQIQLKSIKNLNPDSDECSSVEKILHGGAKHWESAITPDSLEIVDQNNSISRNSELLPEEIIPDDLEAREEPEMIDSVINETMSSPKNPTNENDPEGLPKSNKKIPSQNSSSTTDNSETTTGSEPSSDELHEYEISPHKNSPQIPKSSPLFVSTPKNTSSRAAKILENPEISIDLETKTCGLKIEPRKAENVDDIISSKIHSMFKKTDSAHDETCSVRGEKLSVNQVGESEVVDGGGNDSSIIERGDATSRLSSVELCTPTRKDNGCFSSTATAKIPNEKSGKIFATSNNKYRSLVMITQGSYQPVSVVTSDTTTLLQPSNENSSQGLAGYFHLALETSPQNGQTPRRPLMVKRFISTQDQEIDSGLSVGSASESDDVQSVKNLSKVGKEISGSFCQKNQNEKSHVPETSEAQFVKNSINPVSNEDRQKNSNSHEDTQSIKNLQNSASNEVRSKIVNTGDDAQSVKSQKSFGNEDRKKNESQPSDDNSGASGLVILEEGLADDDSWVEEVSHDEDETSATTATEESSEDEANNLGDREEELRGYHRQAIDFTLHTIVEESCEESETEPSIATSPRKKRPPSASELEKYFFFGLGGENSTASREIDSLSETSSIYSEGLESLNQEENSTNLENKGSNEFLNSSRLEKYFLSEFLGFDQDRRDSDGSVGSDSEGRPSPEAQRRKRLVRARGTGRSSHSSSLDNLLALAQGTQNLSSQNSLQDLSLAQESQETQSEGSSTETDGADEANTTPAFGTDGQFDTVKRKKKKPRNLGTQSPRVPEDKTPEPRDGIAGEMENEIETGNSEDERAKTPQPENSLHSSSSSSSSSSQIEARGSQASSSDSSRGKQQSRDSGFVGSCDDLLQSQKPPPDGQSTDPNFEASKDSRHRPEGEKRRKSPNNLQPPPNASLSRKDSFNNWSSDEETNLMMSKMRQFFKTMVANSNGQAGNSSGASPAPSPRLSGYSRTKISSQNRTKPPQLVYFENELTRLMKTVPGIRDEQVREIVEYLSSEDTWSDSYDSSDYTSSDLEGAAGGRRSALQEQISQSCQQIIDKFDTNLGEEKKEIPEETSQPCLGRDTAFVYQKLVQSFTKIAGDAPSAETSSAHAHSSPPLIAKVMHHIGSRLVALMHEVSEGGTQVQPPTWRRYSQHHHRTPSSASTTEDDDSTSDSTNPPSSHLPRSKSHDPLLLINGHPATLSGGQEGEEREASDYERFSWRGSFESALMAADSRTKLSLLACSGDVSACASASALAMAAKRRSAGDLLFNPKSFSREQLDRVRSCGSIGGGGGGGSGGGVGGSIEEKIWSNRRRSSVPDANTRGESGASAGDDDTEDELEYGADSRATTLPRGMQAATGASAATNSLPRLPASTTGAGISSSVNSTTPIHKAHSVYHFLPQHTGVKSARYRPPGFARNSLGNAGGNSGPKRAVSAPGLQVSGNQTSGGKRENSRSRRQQQAISLTPDDGSSLSEACSTPIIGAGSRAVSSNTVMDIDEMDRGLHSGHMATRASLSSLGARSDSMASVYSGAGEGRWCGSVAVRGEVEFSLQYDYKQLTFEVHVTQCKDLAPVDIKRNRSDPYVKVYLLPDKSKSGKRKTKVKKHTLNPVFDETLKFHMSLNGLETRTLWLTVWHSDMFGRNDFLGEVRMPLENKIFDDPTPRWYSLQERTEPFDDPIAYKGEVIVGLKFVPPDPAQLERERETSIENRGLSKGRKNWSRGSLHVLVKEARNLQTRAKNSGTCDPFCKSYLLPDKGRSGKQKTGVVRRSGGSPVWGHTFVYKDVSLQELAERGLELTVWDHDRIASNEFLGGVRFNLGSGKHYGKVVDWMDATGRELSLWQSMLERPNFWVEGAVTLRPNLHNHGKNGGP